MKRALSVVILATACGGSSHTTTPTPAAKVAWKDMNADQRHEYMEQVVLPKAKEVFVAFDAEQYKEMDCKTCHGAGAEDGSFEMPTPDLKPLPATEEAFKAWMEKDPEALRVTKFMGEQVVPLTAELLGATPFDWQTGKGDFSCSACHTNEPTPAP